MISIIVRIKFKEVGEGKSDSRGERNEQVKTIAAVQPITP